MSKLDDSIFEEYLTPDQVHPGFFKPKMFIDPLCNECIDCMCDRCDSEHPSNKKINSLYVIGSLRNEEIPGVAQELREKVNLDVFDDWYAAGPEADDYWKRYEEMRGRGYKAALSGYAARNVFAFDRTNLDRSDAALLVLPAGKSGHLELGYMAGRGKPTFILLDRPDRWDVMYQFATEVFVTKEEMFEYFR